MAESNLGEDQKNLVRRTYDEGADRYLLRNSLQTGNLLKLSNYLERLAIRPVGTVLDVGCGVGTLARLLRVRARSLWYVGLDISINMLRHAAGAVDGWGTLALGDAERLPLSDATFDALISNSVYHWLNVPEFERTPLLCWQEAHRVLKPGGYFALSVAGAGTATRFQACYRNLAKQFEAHPGFDRSRFREDPIGCMEPRQVASLLSEAGFRILFITMDDDGVRFESAADYISAVEAYGYDMYMAPFSYSMKPEVWNMLRKDFLMEVPGTYLHDQYMVYAIVQS